MSTTWSTKACYDSNLSHGVLQDGQSHLQYIPDSVTATKYDCLCALGLTTGPYTAGRPSQMVSTVCTWLKDALCMVLDAVRKAYGILNVVCTHVCMVLCVLWMSIYEMCWVCR